jgi:hypothetical protein
VITARRVAHFAQQLVVVLGIRARIADERDHVGATQKRARRRRGRDCFDAKVGVCAERKRDAFTPALVRVGDHDRAFTHGRIAALAGLAADGKSAGTLLSPLS